MPLPQSLSPLQATTPLMLGDAHSHIERLALRPNSYSLTLRGYLTTGWTGRLASGLAQHGVGIVRGEAERDASCVWHSSLEIRSTTLPFGIDFVALTKNELPAQAKRAPLELRGYHMEPPAKHGGSLYLEVEAADRLGFLGDLLDYFSFKCLFPVRMTIETHGTAVSDKFWLRGMAGSVPSDSLYHALSRDLEGVARG